MKILFGTTHYGKDTSEVPSGFLVWLIEEYTNADWSLIQACKIELSARLKLDFVAPLSPLTKKEQVSAFKRSLLDKLFEQGQSEEFIREVDPAWIKPEQTINSGAMIVDLLTRIDLLEKCLIMSTHFRASSIEIDGYLQNPKLLEQNLKFIRTINQPS